MCVTHTMIHLAQPCNENKTFVNKHQDVLQSQIGFMRAACMLSLEVDAAWRSANEFFALPDAEKMPYHEVLAKQRCGWGPLHNQT